MFCARNTHIENYYVFLKNWHLYHNEMLLFIHDNFSCFEFFFCLKLKQLPPFLLIKASVDLFPFIFLKFICSGEKFDLPIYLKMVQKTIIYTCVGITLAKVIINVVSSIKEAGNKCWSNGKKR